MIAPFEAANKCIWIYYFNFTYATVFKNEFNQLILVLFCYCKDRWTELI